MIKTTNSSQDKALNNLFNFLRKNHSLNHAFQLIGLKRSILPFRTEKEKVRSLLVSAANTQASAKLDKLSDLWSKIASEKADTFSSANKFAAFLKKEFPPKKEPTGLLDDIFCSLKEAPGLGQKTAALFTKNLVHLHHTHPKIGYPNENIGFWSDAELQCTNADKIYLPVDSVIIHIIERTEIGSNFVSINKSLHNFMKRSKKPMIDMVYWDDLWYWGFFNQHGSGDDRKIELNKGKFMSWVNSSDTTFEAVKPLAKEFRGLCERIS